MTERVEEIRAREIVEHWSGGPVREATDGSAPSGTLGDLVYRLTATLAQAEREALRRERDETITRLERGSIMWASPAHRLKWTNRKLVQAEVALAQAERDVRIWKDMGEKEHALAVLFSNEKEQAELERDAARAEVERLKERHEDTLTTLQETAKRAIQAQDALAQADRGVGLAAEVTDELAKARAKHAAPMHGPHEGYAVILEELDELWGEVRAQKPDTARMRKEAIQIAAMALRFIEDVCGSGLERLGSEGYGRMPTLP